jgi:methionyl-tRNA formyltransferase
LARLAAEGHEIALVVTQPDRPAARGLKLLRSPVKRFALASSLEVFQPETLKAAQALDRVRAARPDALVVAAYGLILPQPLLEVAPHGALNIHASLLPRWRGAAPIQRALLAGDAESGVSIMQMDAGLDTGPVLAQRALAIAPDEDAASLHDKLAALGAGMIVAVLEDVAAGRARPVPQPLAGITYAPKIDKREAVLDWTRPALELERAVRAFNPATTVFNGEAVKVWKARVVQGQGAPGAVLDAGKLVVACGANALAIMQLQRAGGKRLSAADFLRGRALAAHARFE